MTFKQEKQFTYFNQILKQMLNNQIPSITEINLSGARKSGKTMAVYLFIIAIFLTPSISADIYMLRNQVNDAWELYSDIVEWLQETNSKAINYNSTRRHIRYMGKVIRVMGLETNKKAVGKTNIKAGLKSGKGKQYGIIFFEEATEFNQDKINAFMEAIRGYKHIIIIKAANPWSIKNFFISYCNENMRYEEDQLIDKGYQFYQKGNKLFHYTTWIHNTYLQPWEREALLDLVDLDPARAKISTYGMPGVAEGTIYSGYYEKIKDIKDLPTNWRAQVREFKGGVDWGIRRDATVAHLWASTYGYKHIIGLDRYRHTNTANRLYKSSTQMVQEIIQFYIEQKLRFNFRDIEVGVDNAAFGIIEMLNQEAANRGLSRWLFFKPSIKFPILDRIDLFSIKMRMGDFYVDKKRMSGWLEEIETSQYEENITGKRVRVDINDHEINAGEYALAEEMYQWVPEYNQYLKE